MRRAALLVFGVVAAARVVIAVADTDEGGRLRLLRAIRDLDWQQEWQQPERIAQPSDRTPE